MGLRAPIKLLRAELRRRESALREPYGSGDSLRNAHHKKWTDQDSNWETGVSNVRYWRKADISRGAKSAARRVVSLYPPPPGVGIKLSPN
jgi:hypothetical protein